MISDLDGLIEYCHLSAYSETMSSISCKTCSECEIRDISSAYVGAPQKNRINVGSFFFFLLPPRVRRVPLMPSGEEIEELRYGSDINRPQNEE